MTRRDPFDNLRYYPAFIVVVFAFFVAWNLVLGAYITGGLMNQVVVPRLHPLNLQPGDRVETGAKGSDRPVLIRHADGSVTNAGQMRGVLNYIHPLPQFIAVALAMFATVWLLSKVWPRCPAENQPLQPIG
jgi:hypothetical protein